MKINFIYSILICCTLASELKVLTYNIHALSPFIAGDDPHGRIPKILSGSSENNIIFFQENWIFSDKYFNRQLPEHQIIKSKTSKFFWPFNNSSGLTLALSDSIKILETNDVSYGSCSGWISKDNDCLATKGFQHVRIEIDGDMVDLYNTHLDAGNSRSDIETRRLQIKQLESYAIKNSAGIAVIIAGDLNVSSESDEFSAVLSLCAALGVSVADWVGTEADSPFGKLDYILYRGSLDTVIELNKCSVDSRLNGLSDHPPIKASFNYTR